MKRLFATLLIAIVAITALSAKEKKSNNSDNAKAEITFAETAHDFGYIPEDGGLVTCEFEFTNTGDAPLVIVDVKTSCGCTTPKYSTKPIKPGKSGEIKVSYNPKYRPGAFKKAIRVISNTPKKFTTLNIIGSVIPEKRAE